jgi:hypothetical protein
MSISNLFQPNNLSLYCDNLTASGNISGQGIILPGNISCDNLVATGNVTADNLIASNDITASGGTLTSVTITSPIISTAAITNPTINGGTISTSTISNSSLTTPTITGLSNDNTQTKILAINGSNSVIYRNIPQNACGLISTYLLATTQSIQTGIATTVQFPAGQLTNGIGFTYSGSPQDTFIVPISGIYLIHYSIIWNEQSSNTLKESWITSSLSEIVFGQSINIDSGITNSQNNTNTAIINLTATSTFTLSVDQNSGSTYTILGNTNAGCYLAITLIQAF